jgi:ATP-dependent DNA helicase RecQ
LETVGELNSNFVSIDSSNKITRTANYKLLMDKTKLEKHLKKIFKFEGFRYPQEEIIQRVFEKKSTLALMPTGAGKSLTYQFCASLAEGNELVVVVSPLIALMQDQTKKAVEFGIEATFINSSLNLDQKNQRMKQISEGRHKLLFVAPERFQKPEFWQCLASRRVHLMVIDEAHCVSLWGHDFRPDYFKLQSYREKLNEPTLLALTATATSDVQSDIAKQFHLDLSEDLILGGLERPNLSLNFINCFGEQEKNEELLDIILEKTTDSGIVYFALIQTLESVSRFLNSKKIAHVKYHGDLNADQRKRNQEDFLKGKTKLILATPAFGLGIDKSDIRYVAHYEIPSSIEAYFQEVGRAGRDGLPADAFLLYDEDDLSIQMQFLNWAYPENAFIQKVFDLIKTYPQKCDVEGFDFLREQMVFKNKKDFRVNAAVSILTRWGCLEEVITPFGYKAIKQPTEDDFKLEDQNVLKREHQKKLLSLVQFVKNDEECRLKQVYRYFSHEVNIDCGQCDVCRK